MDAYIYFYPLISAGVTPSIRFFAHRNYFACKDPRSSEQTPSRSLYDLHSFVLIEDLDGH
jgi:hypothetical protein